MNTYRLLLLNVAIATVAAQIGDVPWKRAKCQVSLYDSCDGQAWATFGLGEYSKSDLEAKGFKDNLLSGIKIEGDESCRVELFDDPNDEGKDRFDQKEGPEPKKKGPIMTFYKGHSKFSWRKKDGTYEWSDSEMKSEFSDGECHEYGNYGAVTSAPFKKYNDRTSSIRVAWRNAKTAKAKSRTLWPDVGRAEFKDDFDANWGESQCICELADEEKNMCIEAFSDREPRCQKYHDLVKDSCKSNPVKVGENTTKVREAQVCGWKERCANFADNPTLSSCIGHTHKFCALRRYLGGDVNVTVEDKENPVVWRNPCEAEQTCCDGQCCDAKDEVCVPMNSKSFGKRSPGVSSDYRSIISAVGGKDGKGVFYYDFLLYDLEAVEVNGWKMPNGDEFKNRPMMCQKKIPDWDRVTLVRIFYRPFLLVWFWAGLFGALVNDGGMKVFANADNLPALLLLLCSLLLIFTPFSNLTVFLIILGCVTMMWPRDKWHQWLALGQFLALWYLLGGANVLLHNNGADYAVSFRDTDYAYTTDHHQTVDSLRGWCAEYYNGHFLGKNNPYENAWVEERSTHKYENAWGLCHGGWVATSLYLGQILIFLLATMMMTSFARFARPEDEPNVWCCCKKQVDNDLVKQKSIVTVVKPAPSSVDETEVVETEQDEFKKDDDPAETETGEEFKKDDV